MKKIIIITIVFAVLTMSVVFLLINFESKKPTGSAESKSIIPNTQENKNSPQTPAPASDQQQNTSIDPQQNTQKSTDTPEAYRI
jgi:flagellar basal body-associated protein FliL